MRSSGAVAEKASQLYGFFKDGLLIISFYGRPLSSMDSSKMEPPFRLTWTWMSKIPLTGSSSLGPPGLGQAFEYNDITIPVRRHDIARTLRRVMTAPPAPRRFAPVSAPQLARANYNRRARDLQLQALRIINWKSLSSAASSTS